MFVFVLVFVLGVVAGIWAVFVVAGGAVFVVVEVGGFRTVPAEAGRAVTGRIGVVQYKRRRRRATTMTRSCSRRRNGDANLAAGGPFSRVESLI